MITKRQLGFLLAAIALLFVVGIVAVDMLGAGKWGGFGPLQRIGIAIGAAGVVVGAILIRIGDRPA
jgi:hypothetical protein